MSVTTTGALEIVVQNASGAPPTYAGWYFDLFSTFSDATADADFVASYASNIGSVMYIGAGQPRLGVFVVDVGGAPRVAVGPVASSFETVHPIADGRLTDNDRIEPAARRDPWAASYTVTATATPPPLHMQQQFVQGGQWVVMNVEATAAVGTITLELLDHHRVPMATVTTDIKPGKTQLRLRNPKMEGEMLHLRAGDFQAWIKGFRDDGFMF
jgi:hypothetical protein